MLARSAQTISCLRRLCVAAEGNRLTHLDERGRASMVNVGSKIASQRTATATATVHLGMTVYEMLSRSMRDTESVARTPTSKKGDVFTVSELAGIMAAKRTPELIPLCHSVPLAHVSVDLKLDEAVSGVQITATAATGLAQTGVEMEALTAASVAALTVYDMCKAGSKAIEISGIRLLSKTGGKSGEYRAR